MNDPRYQTLIAKSAQEIDGTPETVPTVGIKVTHTECCGTLIDSPHFASQILPHYITGKPALSVRNAPHEMQLDRIRELIALLQRAEREMGGGA